RRGMGGFAFGVLFVFIAFLALGLAFVWRIGDLVWIRQARQDTLDEAEPEDRPARSETDANELKSEAA
ncbi:MAG: hypothetical protein ACHQ17_11205, partial [Polyangia bacterium]